MNHWSDKQLQQVIGVILRLGVLLSAAVVFAGGACYLTRHGKENAGYHAFHSAPEAYRSVAGVIHSMGPSDCGAIIQFGLLLLIATPICRVAFSLLGFGMERDWTYVVLTSIVLVVLLYSIAFEH